MTAKQLGLYRTSETTNQLGVEMKARHFRTIFSE